MARGVLAVARTVRVVARRYAVAMMVMMAGAEQKRQQYGREQGFHGMTSTMMNNGQTGARALLQDISLNRFAAGNQAVRLARAKQH